MKKLFTTILLGAAALTAEAQTTAPDFTATDCGGTPHTLYNELDADKVAIMVWVMPCPSCVNGAQAAYNTWKQFETSHPGKVKFYIMDDLGDINCSDLETWVHDNVTTDPVTIFDNDNEVIDEDDYGGTGMPHVLITAGKDHKIYWNKKNTATNNPTAMKDAVQTALDNVLSVSKLRANAAFTIQPNPVSDVLKITSRIAITKIVVASMSGQVVREEAYSNGILNAEVNMSSLPAGVYNVKLIDAKGTSATQKVVKQ